MTNDNPHAVAANALAKEMGAVEFIVCGDNSGAMIEFHMHDYRRVFDNAWVSMRCNGKRIWYSARVNGIVVTASEIVNRVPFTKRQVKLGNWQDLILGSDGFGIFDDSDDSIGGCK